MRLTESQKILKYLKEEDTIDDKKWEEYVWYAENADEEMLCDDFYDGDWDEFESETANHIAGTIYDTVGPEEFDRMVAELKEVIAEDEAYQRGRTGPSDKEERKKWWGEQLKNKPKDISSNDWNLILKYVTRAAGADLREDYTEDEVPFDNATASQIAINIINNIGKDTFIKKINKEISDGAIWL